MPTNASLVFTDDFTPRREEEVWSKGRMLTYIDAKTEVLREELEW